MLRFVTHSKCNFTTYFQPLWYFLVFTSFLSPLFFKAFPIEYFQGAAAQGCNPFYAKDVDVMVPNVSSDTSEVISTGEDSIQTTYKSEVNFQTAYSGYSTRNIIMEERNVYCGAYNVLVLSDM